MGKFHVRSLRLPLSDRRQQLKELRESTECYAGRKGHWAHDYECATFPFNLFPEPPDTRCPCDDTTTSFQPIWKVTACFVLDDCDANYETFASMVDGEESLSVEPTTQTSSTPIAFNAVDTR